MPIVCFHTDFFKKHAAKKEENKLKKKFFHIVSLVVAFTMISVMGLPAVYADGERLALDVSYNADAAEFSVEGKLPKAGRSYVNVIIAPYGAPVDSVAAISDEDVILKTVQSSVRGEIDMSITMPDGELAKKYSYSVFYGDLCVKGVFATVDSSAAGSAVPAVNGASADAMEGVIKSSLSALVDENDDIEYIAAYIYAVKPEDGYDAESLIDAYMTAFGLSIVADNDIGLGEFFTAYAQYLPNDYRAEYDALNSDTKAALEEMFEKYPVEGSFDKSYKTNLFVAGYKGIESAAELKTLVLDYLRSTDYDFDDYNNIGNSVYQEKVFDDMYAGRASVDNVDDIIDAFEEAVYEQADRADSAASGSGGSGGGGGGGKKGGTTGSIGTVPEVPAVIPSGSFADMADHWAKADVEAMYSKGIVSGFPDGTFRPGQNVTRAEFAKMIAVSLGLDTSAKADFADVGTNEWYTGFIGAAVKAGIVKGTSETTFEPEKYITRQDAAVMLARVIEYKGKTYPAASKGFNDEASIAEYALGAVNGLANLGLINGYNGGFAPLDNTTRAEAAALLLRVSDYVK